MKLLVFVANGTEDSELVTTISLLKRANIDSYLISTEDSLVITGSHSTRITCDELLSNLNLRKMMDYDGLFFPGGKRGVNTVKSKDIVIDLIKEYNLRGKPIMAICAAPTILGKAQVLTNKKYTCYDGFNEEIMGGEFMQGSPAIRDKNIITGRSAGHTTEFALTIIEYLKGKEESDRIAKAILL